MFTVVTIFFVSMPTSLPLPLCQLTRIQLPLSFFATLFGMNAQEINDGKMSMTTQLRWMCRLSKPSPETRC